MSISARSCVPSPILTPSSLFTSTLNPYLRPLTSRNSTRAVTDLPIVVGARCFTSTCVPTDCSPGSTYASISRMQVSSISWTIDGVEYIGGTLDPRCVVPIGGVVATVISSTRPGAKPDFNLAPSSALPPAILAHPDRALHPSIAMESAAHDSCIYHVLNFPGTHADDPDPAARRPHR